MIKGSIGQARGLWIGMLSFAITASVMLVNAPPAQAQSFSDSHTFIKAVKDREGAKAKELMDQPGSVVVNSRDGDSGDSGLHIVVKGRDLAWLGFLLKNGANPDLRDVRGNSPLMLAARIGFGEAVDVLLAVRAKVDLANSDGDTPLIAAVQGRNLEVARQLVAAGANPKQTNNAGLSARDYAERDSRAGPLIKILDAAKPKPARVMGPGL